ncbi:MAG: T9SS type A sorting domain-containing protein [Crocinitomicaceae bacterium]
MNNFKLGYLYLFIVFPVFSIKAQSIQFSQVPPLLPNPQNIADFDRVQEGSVDFGDVDNDGDADVIITGFNLSANYCISKLYLNDGLGGYSEDTSNPFEGVSSGSVAFADIDSDNDLDLLISGYTNLSTTISKLYINDGMGNFVEDLSSIIEDVRFSSVVFFDMDNDSDQDIVISGENNSGQKITKLYANDGTGGFSEVLGTPFVGLRYSTICVADIDLDNDIDILITGKDVFQTTKLYTNDGAGNFTEVLGTTIDNVLGDISFADVDNDNDPDLLITGHTVTNSKIAKLYINDGTGNFTEDLGTPFDGVNASSIEFMDIDNDNDKDLFLSGRNSSDEFISKLYENDGTGIFSEVLGTPFEGVIGGSGATKFSDVNNDSYADLLITGIYKVEFFTTFPQTASYPMSKLYINDGTGGYLEATGTPLKGVANSSIAFADIDNDNDQDLLITGRYDSLVPLTVLYKNDGFGNLEEAPSSFINIQKGSVCFSDIDNDNDQDVLITGERFDMQTVIALYKNDGIGGYTEVLGIPFMAVKYSSISFADIDGDNDNDLLITGKDISNQPISKLYKNDGSGNFTEDNGVPFEGVFNSSISFYDMDGDNDKDVIICGENNSGQFISKLYENDGSGNFTELIGTPFDGISNGVVLTFDVDNDLDFDILVIGEGNSGQPISKMYKNDGSGNFTEVIGSPFTGLMYSSAAFADLDNDGDQDLLMTGYTGFAYSDTSFTQLFSNDGAGNFSLEPNTPFKGKIIGSIAFSHVDNDPYFDLVITGGEDANWINKTARLFKNVSCLPTSLAPDLSTLPDLFGECSLSSPQNIPTATNTCGAKVQGTPDVIFPISTQGITSVTWTFNDGRGNIISQVQNITIEDITDPIPDNVTLTDITDECSVTSITAPTATDNCSGAITATTSTTFPITMQGTTVVTWTYDDGNGNIITQDQNVIITDVTDPVPDVAMLADINAMCEVTSSVAPAPMAADYCAGAITATPDITFPITNQAVTQIVWTYDDGNGNTITQNQAINWIPMDVSTNVTGTTITANNSNGSYKWLDCNNNHSIIQGENNINYTATTNGNYAVEITENGCVDTSLCVSIQNVSIEEAEKRDFQLFPNPTDGQFQISSISGFYNMTIRITDVKGKEILRYKNVNGNQIKIDLSPFEKGTYFLFLKSEQSVFSRKIVKD